MSLLPKIEGCGGEGGKFGGFVESGDGGAVGVSASGLDGTQRLRNGFESLMDGWASLLWAERNIGLGPMEVCQELGLLVELPRWPSTLMDGRFMWAGDLEG